jgi:hypothetical protein
MFLRRKARIGKVRLPRLCQPRARDRRSISSPRRRRQRKNPLFRCVRKQWGSTNTSKRKRLQCLGKWYCLGFEIFVLDLPAVARPASSEEVLRIQALIFQFFLFSIAPSHLDWCCLQVLEVSGCRSELEDPSRVGGIVLVPSVERRHGNLGTAGRDATLPAHAAGHWRASIGPRETMGGSSLSS